MIKDLNPKPGQKNKYSGVVKFISLQKLHFYKAN